MGYRKEKKAMMFLELLIVIILGLLLVLIGQEPQAVGQCTTTPLN